MVENVRVWLEWCVSFLASAQRDPNNHCCVRCLWYMGLWSILGQSLVSTSMAVVHPTNIYSSEGVYPSYSSYCAVWASQVVQFQVDNQVVVDVVSSTYSRNSHLMHLIRLLVFFAAKYSFWFTAMHVPGKSNYLADALSRNNLPLFLSQVPEASPWSPSIPEDLVTLMSQDINWTSTHWMSLFISIIQLH